MFKVNISRLSLLATMEQPGPHWPTVSAQRTGHNTWHSGVQTQTTGSEASVKEGKQPRGTPWPSSWVQGLMNLGEQRSIWGCFPPALFLVVTGATNAISKAYAHEVSQGLACVVGELLLSVCLLSANPIRLRIVCFIWFPQTSSPPGSLPSAPQGGGGCLHWASTDPWCSPIIALIYSFKTYLYTPSTCQASSRCQGYSSEQNRLKKIKRPCHHEAYVEVRADQRK